MGYLLSHHAGWEADARDIEEAHGIGREARQRVYGELELAGYLTARRTQDERGRWSFGIDAHEEAVPEDQRTKSLGAAKAARRLEKRLKAGQPKASGKRVHRQTGNPSPGTPANGSTGERETRQPENRAAGNPGRRETRRYKKNGEVPNTDLRNTEGGNTEGETRAGEPESPQAETLPPFVHPNDQFGSEPVNPDAEQALEEYREGLRAVFGWPLVARGYQADILQDLAGTLLAAKVPAAEIAEYVGQRTKAIYHKAFAIDLLEWRRLRNSPNGEAPTISNGQAENLPARVARNRAALAQALENAKGAAGDAGE